MQNWRKLGRIYEPDTSKAWAASGYCHVPTAIRLASGVRMYFASLDKDMRGRVAYVDLDPDDLTRVKSAAQNFVLDVGPAGTFDCDGVVPSCAMQTALGMQMWYIGFQRCQTVPYMLFSGIALSNADGDRFTRRQNVPALDRTPREPYLRSAPFVMAEGNRERTWYLSCMGWSDGHYNNVIMHKDDTGKTHVCIVPEAPDYAVGRPWVVKEGGLYKMWYSIRSTATPGYRMGYAESLDGLQWARMDDEVASFTADGKDAEYPCVIDSGGKRWMLYNGEGRGKLGIELAVLDAD